MVGKDVIFQFCPQLLKPLSNVTGSLDICAVLSVVWLLNHFSNFATLLGRKLSVEKEINLL